MGAESFRDEAFEGGWVWEDRRWEVGRVTLAMAAGISNHVWTIEEIVSLID
jgi:hypothetical protein